MGPELDRIGSNLGHMSASLLHLGSSRCHFEVVFCDLYETRWIFKNMRFITVRPYSETLVVEVLEGLVATLSHNMFPSTMFSKRFALI